MCPSITQNLILVGLLIVDFFNPIKVLLWGLLPPLLGFISLELDKYSSLFLFFFNDFEEIAFFSLFAIFFFPVGFMKYYSLSLWFFFFIFSQLFSLWYFSVLILFRLWDLLLSLLFYFPFNYLSFRLLFLWFGITSFNLSELPFLWMDDFLCPCIATNWLFFPKDAPKRSRYPSLDVAATGWWPLPDFSLLLSKLHLEWWCFFFFLSS